MENRKVNISKEISILERAKRKFLDEKLKDYKIDGYMIGYIFTIIKNPGITTDEIATNLLVNKSSASRVVEKLSANNYVNKIINSKDKRILNIYATSELMNIRIHLVDAINEFNNTALLGIIEDDKEKFCDLLIHVKENLLKSFIKEK